MSETILVVDEKANVPDIYVDPDRIFQALANLVSNAIRHTPAGGDDSRHGGKGKSRLGLAIAKSIVGMHGGSISAASGGPGLGSRFTIMLEAAQQRYQPAPEPEHPVFSM